MAQKPIGLFKRAKPLRQCASLQKEGLFKTKTEKKLSWIKTFHIIFAANIPNALTLAHNKVQRKHVGQGTNICLFENI